MIHLESCLDTLQKDVKYDYVLTSPPDYAELGIPAHTNENDVVYDPFMGSGTTAIAALEVDRNYLGSEISEEYYKLCKKRIESDLTLR